MLGLPTLGPPLFVQKKMLAFVFHVYNQKNIDILEPAFGYHF